MSSTMPRASLASFLPISALVVASACVRLDVAPEANGPPVAVVTESMTVAAGAFVQLDGSASSDPDGDTLSFRWEQVSPGEPVQLSGRDTPVASFFAPRTGQRLYFRLTVSDGAVPSEPITVHVRVNGAPVATAPALVNLTGSSSVAIEATATDPDGDAIASYRWRVASAPLAAASCTEAPSPCLSGADTAKVTFSPPLKGEYGLELVVSDGHLESAPVLVAVRGPNFAPSAAPQDEVLDVSPGALVLLVGAGSDPDGDTLTYRWRQREGIGQPVLLQNADTAQASFVAPAVRQSLFFELTVSDGELTSEQAVVHVRVNTAPIANAGANQVINDADSTVVVGAGADPDGDVIIAYEWRVVSAPASGASCVTPPPTPSPCLLGDTSPIVTFTAPSPDARGDYVLELRVSDGKLWSLPSQVTLSGPNARPAASAPSSVLVATSATVSLVGSGSDADGDALTYQWTQLSGDPVQLTGADAAAATFTAPDVGQRMYFSLTVSDGLATSDAAIVYVRVNAPPQADAGAARDVVPGVAVLLQGSAFDPDQDLIVTYDWRVASAPSGSSCLVAAPALSPCFSGPGASGAIVFTAPSKGDYVLELVVSDGELTSLPASVLIRAVNRAPTALASFSPAGPFRAGDVITLDAAGSTDVDGDAVVSWRWTVLDKPLGASVAFSPVTADAQQTQVTLAQRGSYLFGLTVTDDDPTNPASGSDSVRVEIGNTPPSVDAGVDVAVPNGTEAILLGGASDADLDALTYTWVMLEAPDNQTVSLTGADGPTVRFTPTRKTPVSDPAQCLPGQCYRLALTVGDGRETSTDYVVVTSLDRKPIANAGPDFSVLDSSLIELDALASFDPDGDAITVHRWTQLLGPDVTGGAGYMDGAQLGFSAPGNGTYVFSLSVRAAGVWSAADELTINVNNGDQRPTLTSAGTEFSAVEGSAFVGFGFDASDAEPGTLTITWTRLEGSSAFPAQLQQSQTVGGVAPADPLINISSYAALFDGFENATHARYRVVAQDVASNQSDPVVVTLYVLPNPVNYYFLAPAPLGADGNACTDVAPCYSLRRAAQAAQSTPRDVIMLGGDYNFDWDHGFYIVQWPSNTRLFASREAATYARSATPSHVRADRISCGGSEGAISLLGSTGVVFHDLELDVAGQSSCSIPSITGILCDSCQAELFGVTVNAVQPILVGGGARPEHRGLVATNPGAHVRFVRGALRAVNGTDDNRALQVSNGAVVEVEEAELQAIAGAVTKDNTVAYVNGGAQLMVSRSQLLLYGNDPGAPDLGTGRFSAGVAAFSGNVAIENSVVHVTAGPQALAIYVAGGTLSSVNNTLVAPSSVAGASAGIHATVAVDVMNTLVRGFLTPLVLDGAAALESQLFANAWIGSDAGIASCNGAAVTSIAELNSAPGAGACNQSAVSWSGNIVGPCALANPAARDFHLIAGSGACIDAGMTSSPAGIAPSDDMDATFANAGNTLLNSARPSARSTAVDIGADEAD